MGADGRQGDHDDGAGKAELIADAMAMTAKRGRVVLTNVYNDEETVIHMSPGDLIRMEKQLVGALFGSGTRGRTSLACSSCGRPASSSSTSW